MKITPGCHFEGNIANIFYTFLHILHSHLKFHVELMLNYVYLMSLK